MLSYPGRHCYVKLMPSCENASKRIQGLLEAYFKINKNSGEQEKESIILVRVGKRIHYSCEGRIEKSVPRDHRLTSLGKPRDAKH